MLRLSYGMILRLKAVCLSARRLNLIVWNVPRSREQRAPLESFLSDDETLNGIPGGITSPGYTWRRRTRRGPKTKSNISPRVSPPPLRMSREFKTNVSGKDVIRQDVINVVARREIWECHAKPVKSASNFDRDVTHNPAPLKCIASCYIRSPWRSYLARCVSFLTVFFPPNLSALLQSRVRDVMSRKTDFRHIAPRLLDLQGKLWNKSIIS